MINYVEIDNIQYNVPVVRLDRDADFLYKFAERTVDGKLHSELIGVYFNYDMEFGSASIADYTLLWNKLTEPKEFHTIKVPDENGFHTYSAYFAGVSDSLVKIKGSAHYFRKLKVKFIAQMPARS